MISMYKQAGIIKNVANVLDPFVINYLYFWSSLNHVDPFHSYLDPFHLYKFTGVLIGCQ